jgi:hypothetical protein
VAIGQIKHLQNDISLDLDHRQPCCIDEIRIQNSKSASVSEHQQKQQRAGLDPKLKYTGERKDIKKIK